jgi:geranylgeranyl pyrophosphate synthase
MRKYGEYVGLAFQSIDDLLDGDGYSKVMKNREIRQKVRDLLAHAKREIRPLGKRGEKLQKLADFLLSRLPRGTHVALDR